MKIFVERPIATSMFFIAVLVLGVYSFLMVPVELAPKEEYPRFNIITDWYGMPPEIIQTQVTQDGDSKSDPEEPPSPRSVIIDFFNTGSPVSYEDAKRMFDPFFTTKDNGTGLGLAIAQQVVSAHGGSLTVINQAQTGEQEGVTFRMELPVKGSTGGPLNGSPGPS